MIGSSSILSDIDDILAEGDQLANPFNLLDVKSIKLDPQFNQIFDIIDINIERRKIL